MVGQSGGRASTSFTAASPSFSRRPDVYSNPPLSPRITPYLGISQKLFYKLMGRNPDDDQIDDRITTNNFEVSIDEVSQSALFPEIAMLNHECRPNAAYFFDEQTMTHFIHATRPIYPGEEITITYINNEDVREQRMKTLLRNWGFTCSCSTCTAHSAIVAESDARLGQITTLQEILNDYSEKSQASVEVAELLISLYKLERLDASMGTAYQYAAEAYSSFGMKWEAIKYARLSIDMGMLEKGWQNKEVNKMHKMAMAPELTWSWKKRVGGSHGGCGCGKAH